ncbi:hypothetical protein [Nostoc sp.]|uniref:hypothetical protein n=1 Tax=Nostoc sp. TaxID=1180 RepID=UPI002FF8AF5C
MGVTNTTILGILRLSVKGKYLCYESDVYDGLRLRLSIYTHNRVLEFRSGTTSKRSGNIGYYKQHHCQPKW